MKRFFLVLLPSVVGYGYFLELHNEEKMEALSSLPLLHFHFFFFCPFILRAAPNYLNAWNRLGTGYCSFNVQAKLNLVSFAAVIRGTLRDDPNNGCVGD